MIGTDYRALSVTSVLQRNPALHLIRNDAEASLCGIPRSALGPGSAHDLVCADCIEWLTKRRAVSAKLPSVKRPSPGI